MSYNAENIFDDKNDGSEYPEFKPGRRWTTEMYATRLRALANVIEKAAPGGPDIVALQEIENTNVLESLSKLLGNGSSYPYRCMVPVPGSATNTSIISKYPITRVGAYALRNFENEPLRNIIEAEILVDRETLYLFCNHWKAREGGISDTESARLDAAGQLVRRIAAICDENPDAQIVVAGDLNENADEYSRVKASYQTAIVRDEQGIPDSYRATSLVVSGDPGRVSRTGGRAVLFEPWLESGITGKGSYVYRGDWETIDHILLSHGLFDGDGLEYVKGSFTPVMHKFLLDGKTGFPKGWAENKKGGFSDHLPVILRLAMK